MAVLASFAGGGVGSLGNAEQVGGWVSEVRFLLKRGCESPPMEAFSSMCALGPQALASSPLGMLVQYTLPPRFCFKNWRLCGACHPGLVKGPTEKAFSDLGPQEEGIPETNIFPVLLSPLLPKSTSSICTVLDMHPRGPGDKNSDPRVTLPGSTAPVSLLAASAG